MGGYERFKAMFPGLKQFKNLKGVYPDCQDPAISTSITNTSKTSRN